MTRYKIMKNMENEQEKGKFTLNFEPFTLNFEV